MCLIALGLIYSNLLFGNTWHTDKGTEYGNKGVAAYAESNHGPDGNLFLDPYFKTTIEGLHNQRVLDAGCGAAPWAIYAAKQGGQVYAIDIQDAMIMTAKKAVQIANLTQKVSLTTGDVANLPYQSNFFDRAISICVACNLPLSSFEKHFFEFNRTLKKDATAVVGAPTSLDVVFSDGSYTDPEILSHIQKILSQLPNDPSPEIIFDHLLELKEVLSATFVIKNHRLTLVTNEMELQPGQEIWRKIPKLVVPNHYYSNEWYIKMLKKHKFEVLKIETPHFNSEEERASYNAKAPKNAILGPAYTSHPPFIIYHVKKIGTSTSDQPQ